MLICQLSDLHIRSSAAGTPVPDTNVLTERALRRAAAFQPAADVVLITGDLAESGLAAEYRILAEMLEQSVAAPVYVIPGNHDRREAMRATLGHLPGVTADRDYVQYTVEDLPVRLVMLDTVVPGEDHGLLSDSQLAWLDSTLAAMPSRPTLVGMHHPPFATGIAFMDATGLRNASAFRAVIARHPQVSRIVCGHLHRPVVGSCAQAVVSIAPSVGHQIELALGSDRKGAFNFEPPAFQLHLWRDDCGFVSHTAYTETYPGPFPFISVPDHQETDGQ